MKSGLLAAAALAGFLLLDAASIAQAQTGSFARTCQRCWGGSGWITCQCRRINGSWVSASAQFTRCQRQSLTNLDGRLVCGP